ncbi:MAG: cytochrome c biogenesis CcdA family protein [Candidatus Kariarchaeaceae archaeon]|jgi:cytochrome c-type biogenesis protein
MVATFALLSAFVLGLAASFAPCLFPVLPSFVAFLGKTDTKRFNGFYAGLLVTLGIGTVFVTFGVLLSSFEGILGEFLGKNYLSFRFYQGLILLLLGIMLTTRISFGGNKLSSLSDHTQNFLHRVENPWLLSYLIGVFFSILAAPCAIVVFGSLIVLMANNPGIWAAILLNASFSLGAGIPFFMMGILIPSVKNAVLDNSEKIVKFIPVITGIIISLVGVFLMYDAYDKGFMVVM